MKLGQLFQPRPSLRYGKHNDIVYRLQEQNPLQAYNPPMDPFHIFWLEMLGTFFYQLWSRSFQFPIHWIRPKAVSFPNELPRQPIWDVKVFWEHRNCYLLKSTDLQHWHSFVKVTCSMRLLKLETRMMTGVTWNKWAANFSTQDQIAATLHYPAAVTERRRRRN